MLIAPKNSPKFDFKNLSAKLSEDDKNKSDMANIERFEAFAVQLAGDLQLENDTKNGKNLLPEVLKDSEELLNSYLRLTSEMTSKVLTPATEWFLDNFHIIEDQLRSIKRDLPEDYYKQLPKVKSGDFAGYPRVYAIAHSIVSRSDARLDIENIKKFIIAFQTHTPLTIGELWAVAITLRISLIKRILPLVRRIHFSKKQRENADHLADELLEMVVKNDVSSEDIVERLSTVLGSPESFNRPMIVQLVQRLRDQDPGIFKSIEWIEQTLRECSLTTSELIQLEHFRQAADQVSIGNIITSMRLFSIIDWHDFFEEVSLVNPILAKDPSDHFLKMDIASRDSYRKVIERISRRSSSSELEVASTALELAQQSQSHIGFYLLGDDIYELEKKLKYTPTLRESFVRKIDKNPAIVYFGSIILLMIGFISLFINYIQQFDRSASVTVGLIVLTLIPLSELSIGLVNYITTLVRKPKRLSRMDFMEDGVPDLARTMVVVPCLFNSSETIQDLVNNLEVQYLANQDENIYFSLLGDLKDADSETIDSDSALLNQVHQHIEELNTRYAKSGVPRFYAFHRVRKHNPSEGKWMGWERKRGKIQEFNSLIRGATHTTYLAHNLPEELVGSFKYIITLDADTQLPLQNARRMIATINHPLNRAVYCEKRKRVVKGYGIIQPRISVSLISAAKTRFSQIFSGNTGIDPYTTAVSDVYQDLFGEGTFTGKGLYDIEAFEKSLEDRIPENTILSHDLFEGSFARVGLVTDFELIDDYPSNFETFAKRQHRWTRGDWQLISWLFPRVKNAHGKSVKNNLPFVARWKIFDNLRRSVLAPVTMLWLILAWTTLPGSALVWTIGIVVAMSFPVYASSVQDFFKSKQIPWNEHLKNTVRSTRNRIEQVFMMLVYMPEMAYSHLDSIIRTIYRLTVSRKQMLEWVSFSQTQNAKRNSSLMGDVLTPGPVLAVALGVFIALHRPENLLIALPFLLSWLIAPYITHGTSKDILPEAAPLTESERSKFRRYARMTWHFFENFAGKEENYLAPDNFQEDPKPVIAHRTSPTNIGLQLLANVTAYDFGYLGLDEMIEKIEQTFETLNKLDKFNGHFYNWYDTQSLAPLHPRYISTVDSGNLAGHFITLKQACLELAKSTDKNPDFKQGLKDSFIILEENVKKLQNIPHLPRSGSLKRLIKNLETIFDKIEDSTWDELLKELNQSKKLLNDLVFENVYQDYVKIEKWIETITHQIESYKRDENLNAQKIRLRLKTIAYQAHDMAHNMDFKFLFDNQRKIFAIGYNASDMRRDDSYYDLLASESRLASFFAISKGDVPDEHWFRLGRQLTHTVGSRALISWSATMFEYLMPLLVMKRFEETLLDQTYDSVVRRQIEYGEQRSIPWGVSEAGYNARDLQFNYQYGPFGIPGLGLKRGLRDELVISPYSTMLAAMVLPKESLANLETLEKLEALGHYGFYESIDYTPERIPKNKKSIILHSYMAHHQGMSLLSLNNLLNNNIMQERFHLDPRNQAIQLLLQERIPAVAEIVKPRAEETHVENFARATENHYSRIYLDPTLSTPRTQLLSNGAYSIMVTSAGSGFSKCHDRLINRWKEDPTLDERGQYFYIKNLTSKKTWSSAFQPTQVKARKYEAIFAEDKVEFVREDDQISTHTEIIVSSEDNVEMRKITLTNHSDSSVEIEITSFMEVTLARANDDAAHPSFSNLFIQTEYNSAIGGLLAYRRPRSKSEKEYWGMHVMRVEGESIGEAEFETDRSRFIGRGKNLSEPMALIEGSKLSGSTGAVLDPIFSLRRKMKIPAHRSVKVIFSTAMAYNREEAIYLAQKYQDPNIFLREVNLGWVKSQITLRHLNVSMEKAHIYQRLAGRIMYLAPYLRAQSQLLKVNSRQQNALWAYGISGDIPIILTRIAHDRDMAMVRELLRAHEYLKLKGLKVDLVILNEHATSYLQNLHDEVMRQILIGGVHHLLDQPGGIFVRKADMIPAEDLTLLNAVARVNIYADKGTLEEQLKRRPIDKEVPHAFIPKLQKKDIAPKALTVPELSYGNGLGGFANDGKEYVIHLKDKQNTPAPWINVIANKHEFGFIVSESGSGYTWSQNSRENRISSWSNDPVIDPVSEAIYIRDEETGHFWSPTPLPVRAAKEYLISHGQGFSRFEQSYNGISTNLLMYVSMDASVKIQKLTLRNESDRMRRLSITAYIEWVLGFSHSNSSQTIVTEWDESSQGLFARNSYNNEFAHRVSFIGMSERVSTFTGDRKEFLGRNGRISKPKALTRQGFSGTSGGGHDPCGALQSLMDINAHEEKEIYILIGQGQSFDEALKLFNQYKDKQVSDDAFEKTKAFWDETLKTLEIKTPDASMNLLVNRWLLYQTLSCRYWARTAFYQSGGAYGFRDQLQDVMAMVYSHPEITKAQILNAASRQFPQGDVQHWWHPPTGRGVRTRFSDDLLWLPFVVSHYIQATQDKTILNEMISYIETPELTEGHDETYTQPWISEHKGSLYEHCKRAIDRSLKLGSHGLPLFGSGDWNDGMNRVGHEGKGESVWMSWFLSTVLKNFIPFCDDQDRAVYEKHVETLKENTEKNAWDGNWYIRAYFDNGEKMGSHENDECKIDAIAQSWSILSGQGDPDRVKLAMKSVNEHLVRRDEGIIKLFTPPFDKSNQDPGYIKGYVPGVRENGGQYTHAAIWTMMAYAELGDGNTAEELFSMINPINHAKTMEEALVYKVEPYVIAADIYGLEPHVGRGGWSWYTGSSSWMYRAAVESIVGFKIMNGKIHINPTLPDKWDGFEMTYRRGKTIYEVKVTNKSGKRSMELNGKAMDKFELPILDDGNVHKVEISI